MRQVDITNLSELAKSDAWKAVSPKKVAMDLKSGASLSAISAAFLAIAHLNRNRSLELGTGKKLAAGSHGVLKRLFTAHARCKPYLIDGLVAAGNFFARVNDFDEALLHYHAATRLERTGERRKWIQLNIAKLYFTNALAFEALRECERIGDAQRLSHELALAVNCMKARALLSLGFFAAADAAARKFRGKNVTNPVLKVEQTYLSLLARFGKTTAARHKFLERFSEFANTTRQSYDHAAAAFYELELALWRLAIAPGTIANRERFYVRVTHLGKKSGFRQFRHHIKCFMVLIARSVPPGRALTEYAGSMRTHLKSDNASIVFLTSLLLVEQLTQLGRVKEAGKIFEICADWCLPLRSHRSVGVLGPNLWLELLQKIADRHGFEANGALPAWLERD
jgi:tetratricopeptide (TPR) repeat protein